MNFKEELIEACKRILWLEKEMKQNYSTYSNYLSDEDLLRTIKEIENDEVRHINMAQGILSILL